jgi:DNA-binding SARP family transcriptional activator
LAGVWIQLCGRLVVEIAGRRVDSALPGPKGRLLFAYLVLNRLRPVPRGELVDALWPNGRDGGLAPLLSKLRKVTPIEGRTAVQLRFPADVFVDVEAAKEALHRAEAAVGRGRWADAWSPARVALHTATRGLFPEGEADWLDVIRVELDDVLLRAHECVAAAGIGLGGAELTSALRSARALVARAPLRESGYRLLMEGLDAQGNTAEAMLVHDRLRSTLREEVGVSPSAEIQALHRRLLATE